METWAIVLAAGKGTRFGAAKQFSALGGTRVVDRAVANARDACDHVVLVLPPDTTWDGPPVDTTVVGGETRAASVRAGLDCVPASAQHVFVHDAARPLASPALWAAVHAALLDGVDAAVPALPVTDTLKRVDGDRVVGTVDRDGLVSVQTPQGFRVAALRSAHAAGGDATDDAAFIEAHGGTVVCVPGEITNIKLTRPEDAAMMEAVLNEEERP